MRRKGWRPATQGEVQSSSWGLLLSVPHKQSTWGCLSQCWRGRISLKSTWKSTQGCSRKQCLQAVTWQGPSDEAQLGYPSLMVSLLLKISCGVGRWSVPGGLCSLQVLRHLPQEHQGHGTFQLISLAGYSCYYWFHCCWCLTDTAPVFSEPHPCLAAAY